MGSYSWRHRKSLGCHRRFLQSYRRSLWHCRDPWGDRRPPMLIVAWLVKYHKTSWNTRKKHCDTLWTTSKTWNTLKTLWNIMKHLSFDVISALDAETSALDVETSAFMAATSAIARRSFNATISALNAETSAIARSYRWYRRGNSGDISDCGVGITPQMYNRVTNHGDMSTLSKPVNRYTDIINMC